MSALHRSLIQSLPVFGAMDDAELDDVINRATAQNSERLRRFRTGRGSEGFYVLLNGRLKVVKVTPDG
jgi:hypothetical protein